MVILNFYGSRIIKLFQKTIINARYKFLQKQFRIKRYFFHNILKLLSAMSGKLSNYDNVPLPQDLSEGVDESEWVGIDFFKNGGFCTETRLVCFLVGQYLFPTTKRNITSH